MDCNSCMENRLFIGISSVIIFLSTDQPEMFGLVSSCITNLDEFNHDVECTAGDLGLSTRISEERAIQNGVVEPSRVITSSSMTCLGANMIV